MLDVSFGTYLRFMLELACGLAGMGVVLTIVMEQLFNDWDVFAAISQAIRSLSEGKKNVGTWVSVVRGDEVAAAATLRASRQAKISSDTAKPSEEEIVGRS